MKKIKKFLTSSLLALSLVSKTYKTTTQNIVKSTFNSDIGYCISESLDDPDCKEKVNYHYLHFFKKYSIVFRFPKELENAKFFIEKIEFKNKNNETIYTIDRNNNKFLPLRIYRSIPIYNPIFDFEESLNQNTKTASIMQLYFYYIKNSQKTTFSIKINFNDKYSEIYYLFKEKQINKMNTYPYLYPFIEEFQLNLLKKRFLSKKNFLPVIYNKENLLYMNKSYKLPIIIGKNEPFYLIDKLKNISKIQFLESISSQTDYPKIFMLKKIYYKITNTRKYIELICQDDQFPDKLKKLNSIVKYNVSNNFLFYKKLNIHLKELTKDIDVPINKNCYISIKTLYANNKNISLPFTIPIKFIEPSYEDKIYIQIKDIEKKIIERKTLQGASEFYTFSFKIKLINQSKYGIGENIDEDFTKDFYFNIKITDPEGNRKEFKIPLISAIPANGEKDINFIITNDPVLLSTCLKQNKNCIKFMGLRMNYNIEDIILYESNNPISISINNIQN